MNLYFSLYTPKFNPPCGGGGSDIIFLELSRRTTALPPPTTIGLKSTRNSPEEEIESVPYRTETPTHKHEIHNMWVCWGGFPHDTGSSCPARKTELRTLGVLRHCIWFWVENWCLFDKLQKTGGTHSDNTLPGACISWQVSLPWAASAVRASQRYIANHKLHKIRIKCCVRTYTTYFKIELSDSVLSKTAIFPKKEGRKRELSNESARGSSLREANG